MKIILASQSPRRKQLLGYLVDNFAQQSADIDETVLVNESPIKYVERLAFEKANVVFNKQQTTESTIVIGSDTSVVVDDTILGKPDNLDDCKRMLQSLSNRSHQTLTAFSVISDKKVITKTVTTDVTFKQISESEIEKYWSTGEPQDKAGSYAIQGIGGKFVASINGSVSAVVGLPLVELDAVLKEFLPE